MKKREQFNADQINVINTLVEMAEDVVSNYYKMSSSQWLRNRYDVRTLEGLESSEIADGPFAQIIKYGGHLREASLGSQVYDFYKICLQDHMILQELRSRSELTLESFLLYIIVHELVHVVRFGTFNQFFDASKRERDAEEERVHLLTREILMPVNMDGLDYIFSLDCSDKFA